MRPKSYLICLFLAASAPFLAQTAAKPQPAQKPTASTPATAAPIKDLPVHKVVLYKNGVGYFEHAGTVNGNQRVTIDFTSSQLNDVLQSLTVLDEGGGHIGGVNYNSTTPLAEQLKTLTLGMDDSPTSTELYQALRGQRVEVTGAPGGTINGRLMSIESRSEKVPNDSGGDTMTVSISPSSPPPARFASSSSPRSSPSAPSMPRSRASSTATSNSSAPRTPPAYAISPSTPSAMARASSASATSAKFRSGSAPIASSSPCRYGIATLQGWAVVDNTVGADWDNVQLSLVAGAPQSFIQPLSQPLYSRRPEIPISTEAQTTPQTHEAAEMNTVAEANAPVAYAQTVNVTAQNNLMAPKMMERKVQSYGVVGSAGLGSGAGSGYGPGTGGNYGGGTYRASDAISEGDVTTNAFDDFFQYAITQPVTIHKNESAMVPILQQNLPADHVTLWSEKDPHPLRAVWLNNTSKLTLDTGSFSIFESGEFAGEGLLDPIHPGERRLLSYAADQAIRVRVTNRDSKRKLHHISIHKGSIVETNMEVQSITYTAVNSADEDRTVLIEHPRRTNGWSLSDGIKPDETTADLYRFKLAVPAHSTAKLTVREHGPQYTTVRLDTSLNNSNYLIDLPSECPTRSTPSNPSSTPSSPSQNSMARSTRPRKTSRRPQPTKPATATTSPRSKATTPPSALSTSSTAPRTSSRPHASSSPT